MIYYLSGLAVFLKYRSAADKDGKVGKLQYLVQRGSVAKASPFFRAGCRLFLPLK